MAVMMLIVRNEKAMGELVLPHRATLWGWISTAVMAAATVIFFWFVFVQIGLLPNTEWLRGTVGLSQRGEIEVDARGQTSLPGVFAAGDATTVPYKQIIIAMGEGSKAALGAFDHLIRASAPAENRTDKAA
jgi:thioredoxin reductase